MSESYNTIQALFIIKVTRFIQTKEKVVKYNKNIQQNKIIILCLCINDLPNVSEKLFAILFADDTSVFLEGKDLAEITNTLNAELAKLTVWLSANKLTLNTSKSHFMIFHRAKLKSSDTKIPVILSNTILEQVTFIKFLGVIIDNKLTFECHIVYTKNKISKGLALWDTAYDMR